MADLTNVTDNFWTVASETFTDNLSSSIGALAATVPVNNATEYTNGDQVTLVVEPGTANEAVFTGTKSGNSFINCKWTEGNLGVGHSAGATIVDYITSTQHNMMTKGIQKFANSDGTLKQQPIRDALGLVDAAAAGWEVAPYTFAVSSGYNKGQREYDVTVLANDLTDEYTPGMRFRFSRGTTPPTMCSDLESSSSQYATRVTGSVSGLSFTDDFTAEAWVKLESYGTGIILSRRTAASGFELTVDSTGRPYLVGFNASLANYRMVRAYQSLPLGRWVHVALSLDMSGFTTATNKVYIDGADVPAEMVQSGTNPTALVNTGDLQIGAAAGGNFFDGKIADVRLWSTMRTATQIRDNMNNALVGSETGLLGYWKLNGNFNDSTTNANNLTASGGAVATDVDNPMRSIEYAILHKIAYSGGNTTLTFFTGTDHNIPNMTLTSPYYSSQDTPYGFPKSKNKWRVETILQNNESVGIGAINQWWATIGGRLTVPIGEWRILWEGAIYLQSTVSGNRTGQTLLTNATSPSGTQRSPLIARWHNGGAVDQVFQAMREDDISVTAQENWKIWTQIFAASGSETYQLYAGDGQFVIRAESAYV